MRLTITELTKKFGEKTAVDNVELELTEGIIGLLGPNGAGKTTLLRLICDLIRPDAGAVLFEGENIHEMDEDYRDILGYLPQKVGYYPWFTAEKYMMYLAALKGIEKSEAKQRTEKLLKEVGLYEERNKKLAAFSGGMLQRVGIAQALLNDPKILILDEPTAGLDPQERIRFRSMIAGMAHDRLVLLSTHIVSDIEHTATQAVILSGGEVRAHDTLENIVNTMKGRVCEMMANAEEAKVLQTKYHVVNMQSAGDKLMLRLLCEKDIPYGARLVEPTLEDAYIAYCAV